MPSLDTNILLRLILQDNKSQIAKIEKLFTHHDVFAVADQTIIEMEYILTGYYEFSRVQMAEVVRMLLANQHINMNRRLFERVLSQYEKHRGVSFTDCCLAAYAFLNGQTPLYTLDKKLARDLPYTEAV